MHISLSIMAKESFETIEANIKQRKFSPIYFFCGEEPFFIDKLTDLLEATALNEMEKAFNQTVLYGKDVNARQIVETCGRLPMMAERQVVIIKEAQALSLKDEEEKQLLAYFKQPVKSTLLIFAWKHGKPDGRKSIGKELQKSAVYLETKKLYENQVGAWAKNWLSERKYKIEEQAADLLVEFCGTDLSKIANELEKLILNKEAKTTVSIADIEKQVGVNREYSVFELSNMLLSKNKTKAYKIVNYFVANPKNGPMPLVIGNIYSNFSKLLICHTNKNSPANELAGKLGINPYFVKDYLNNAKNYPLHKIEQVFYMLEEYDLRSKGVNNNGLSDGQLLKELTHKILAL